jgi:hypothetical protein
LIFFRLGLVPSIRNLRKFVQPSVRIVIEWVMIENDQRLVDVHLQIAAGAAEADRHVVRHHLYGDHRQRLGLCRVHLARHDRRARLVFRDHQFGKARARAAGHQPDVVAIL